MGVHVVWHHGEFAIDRLEGKIVVITGAGKGIGRAIAIGFANAGAKVCCASRTELELEDVVSEIGIKNSFFCLTDVTSYSSNLNMFSKTETIFGGVDIVVVNAGISKDPRTVMDSDLSVWNEIIDINLTGAYFTAKAAIPHLIKRGGGKIIFLGSGLGHNGMLGSSAYSCSKAGVSMLVKILAEELREHNIAVNELVPGPVKTTMNPAVLTSISALKAGKSEWNKEPKDVVPMALFMATQPILGATGQVFSMMRRIN